jgi:hypothetical protein
VDPDEIAKYAMRGLLLVWLVVVVAIALLIVAIL